MSCICTDKRIASLEAERDAAWAAEKEAREEIARLKVLVAAFSMWKLESEFGRVGDK